MKTTHTPGPWTVGNGSPTVYAREHAICAGPIIIGCALGNGYPIGRGWAPDSAANARLMAAAPDLLAALEEVRKQLREHVKFNVKRHYSLMVADAAAGTAIAKARGA